MLVEAQQLHDLVLEARMRFYIRRFYICLYIRRFLQGPACSSDGTRDSMLLPPAASQMLVEAQQLHDAVLEARMRMAITSNRLVRCDNPIAAAHLAAIQTRADAMLRECEELTI